jgi:DNA-binding protein HU-beta/integration host factor subunit alpha
MQKKPKKPLNPTTSTRRDISAVVAKTHKIPQGVAYQVIDTAFETLLANLIENGHVELRGFGVFEVVKRKARKGRNPKKPENEVWIPERKSIRFKPSRLLRRDLADANLPDQKALREAEEAEEA